MTYAEHFWERVNKTPTCWLWTKARSPLGYGAVGYHNRVWRAHRVAWVLVHGSIPEGAQVLHDCDTPACVRPDHLFLGTCRDNLRDAIDKGRWNLRGTNHPLAKLTPEAVRALRALRAQGVSYHKLSIQFGVSYAVARRVARGERWAHITEENPEEKKSAKGAVGQTWAEI